MRRVKRILGNLGTPILGTRMAYKALAFFYLLGMGWKKAASTDGCSGACVQYHIQHRSLVGFWRLELAIPPILLEAMSGINHNSTT